jgi:pimeloyl-ACP methyl ester carboxylesterase
MSVRRKVSQVLIIGGLVVLAAAVAGAGWQRLQERRLTHRFPPSGTLVSVNGYSLHLQCEGSGSPIVLVDPGGYGGSTAYASELVRIISGRVRTCAYDPPGQGWSEAGPNPGTILERYRAFASLVSGANLDGPKIMVGESSGAHIARLAATHPDMEVRGLILLDPAFDDLERERAHWSSEDRRRAARLRRLAHAVPVLSEFGLHRLLLGGQVDLATRDLPVESRWFRREQLLTRKAVRTLVERNLNRDSGLDEVRNSQIPEDLPLVVLTAAPGPGSPMTPYQVAKQQYHEDLAARSSRGRHVLVSDSEHAMIGDDPERVAEMVFVVLDALRGPGEPK